MTCCTVNNCISRPHCGSACDCKGHRYPQMSWNIGHKIFDPSSPQCEWGCGSSNEQLGWMTSYTGNNCASWLHCGSACDCKGHFHLQMSWDIGHKTFDLPSLYITSSTCLSLLISWENLNNIVEILSLSPTKVVMLGLKLWFKRDRHADINNICFAMMTTMVNVMTFQGWCAREEIKRWRWQSK